jgi:hypothetical protein
VPEWDPNAGAPVSVAPQVVQLTFARPPAVLVQTTFADTGNAGSATLTTGQSIFINASGWPTIVDITP